MVTFLKPPSVKSLDRRDVSRPGGGEFKGMRPAKAPLPNANEDGLTFDGPGLATESPSPVSVILKTNTFNPM